MSFGDDARRVLAGAGLGQGDPWDALPAAPRPRAASSDLAARRRAGRAAYERANAERGIPAQVYAAAHFLWEDEQ